MNDGGPAFPVADYDQQTFSPNTIAELRRLLSGMTLRDYFAAKAMTAIAVNIVIGHDRLATLAYRIADAMLAERAK